MKSSDCCLMIAMYRQRCQGRLVIGVAIGQVARGGSWGCSVSFEVASAAMATICM
jgi:hypothetical protein